MENKTRKGLDRQQVEESRRLHGANIITPPRRESAWLRFARKFGEPLILILLGAAALSVGIALYEYFVLTKGAEVFLEPAGIVAAIALATGLSFALEERAEREFAILNRVNDDEPVKVVREGTHTLVARREVVVGDLVALAQGDEIPADGRLVEAVALSVDESSLTGEPLCRKTTEHEHFDPEATYPSDHALRGTKVMEGHGLMEVTAVGDNTENGRVQVAATIDNGVETPLNRQLSRLGALISRCSFAIGLLVLLGRWVSFHFAAPEATAAEQAAYMLQSVMLAVTLVVCSVPEGLPMAVTMSLALSMRRMLRTNNLVRKMHACETMGATTVICTDKTGTLTQNRMRVVDTHFFSTASEEADRATLQTIVDEGIAVNTTAALDLGGDTPAALGNPTEGALLIWLHERGVDYEALRDSSPRTAELPFSTERKYMATVVRSAALGGRSVLYVKGAPEIVLELCDPLPADAGRPDITALLAGYQARALRTLGFAFRLLDEGEQPLAGGRVERGGLTFCGIAAIADPVRAEVPEAVAECRRAGIDIKIVTGDTAGTASEIGRQIGLLEPGEDTEGLIVTGPEFAAIADEELPRRVEKIRIICRARPLDKKRLVEALQARGHVVAVTGDGTNDAPALKAAQVGLSMGDGTSVAKEASDITIVDNSFASIGRAVMWGRSLYRNLQRFLLFQLTVNIVACLVVAAGAFMGTESPLTVTQMLWVNLVMDTFAATALSALPPSADVMLDRPRKESDFILSPDMLRRMLPQAAAFCALLLGLVHVLGHADIQSVTDLFALRALSPADGLTPRELTIFFNLFVLMQLWNLFNARAFMTRQPAWAGLGAAPAFTGTVLVILAGQIAIVSLGGRMFGVTALPLGEWLAQIAITSPVLWIPEAVKFLRKRLKGRPNAAS